MSLVPGSTIGTYQIERELGRGGFGIVYIGLDTRLGRRAAIKQLLPELSSNRQIVERFFNEAKAAASINHPGIVEIYDVGWHTDGSAYFAMKLLDGESLARRLRATGPMAFSLAATIARQVASALVVAHARDIVHRDLKPDNIILVPDDEIAIGERAVVLDFGIAKLGGAQSMSNTRSGMMMGTPAYMSPEQCRGAGEADHRTDIYALGCILFEMLTGRTPFVGEGPGEIMGMHQFVDAPTVRSLRPDTPPEFDALISQLLVKKVDQRMQQMTALQTALQTFGTGGRSGQQRAVTPGASTPLPASSPVPPTVVSIPQQPLDPISAHARAVNQPPVSTPPASNIVVDLEASGVQGPARASAVRSYTPATPEFVPGPDAVTTLSSSRGQVTPATGRPRSKLPLVIGGIALAAVVVGIVIMSSTKSSTPPDAAVVAVADASVAVDTAVATLDAAVVVDAATALAPDAAAPSKPDLLRECKNAQQRHGWVDLESCGHALATIDAAAGKTFVDIAKGEALAEIQLRNLRIAVKAKDHKIAGGAYAKIPRTSVYYAEAKEQLAKLGAIGGTTSSAITSYDCAPGTPRKDVGCACPAGYTSKVAQRAATCAKQSETIAPAEQLELLAEAKQAYMSLQYAVAMSRAQEVLRGNPGSIEALTILTMAACGARDQLAARRAFAQVQGPRRNLLKQTCIQKGVTVD